MDRKDEIIRLQSKILHQYAQHELKMIGQDLWGAPADPKVKALHEKVAEITKEEAPVQQTAKEETKAEENQAQPVPKEDIEDLKKELHSYIGLNVIKEEVESLINWIEICAQRKAFDLPTPELSLHMVFSGNPGTGKTMIARLMARIYHSLGILSKGQLVEVDRSGLVAGYVGQTAGKTTEVIKKALGGVLFIDEAYTLINKSENDFGQEAVDTILKAMEDNREDLVVIVAGYTELMEEFIHSNPGLESRFNRFMHFPDYSIEEMMGIFDMRCSQSGYQLAENARDELQSILEEKSKDVGGFGNARGVRNLFEKAIAQQADRLADSQEPLTKELLMTLTEADLNAASEKA
ncbi:MAG: AAA family ATPase [Clostridia bacterium]|nr:AAA family ATPase [Clostridia bacterium]